MAAVGQRVWMALGLLVLAGCPYVGQGRIEDLDGDDVPAIRFGGADCDDNDPEVGNCDADRDGHLPPAFGGDDCDDTNEAVNPDALERCDGIDNDCDGRIDDEDEIEPGLGNEWFTDEDGDGVGAGAPIVQCAAPAGRVATPGDCDDTDEAVFPGAVELCDALDRDCDGDPDAGAADVALFYVDGDGDGFGDPDQFVAEACDAPADTVADGTDCDDADPLVNPGADEVCAPGDEDCDGLEGDADTSLVATVWYRDQDGDQVGQAGDTLQQCAQPDGYVQQPGDCNDFDDAVTDEVEYFPDEDGDGFGAQQAQSVVGCTPPSGFVTNDSDCDDTQPTVSPAGLELCNGVDDDCDTVVDDNPIGGGIFYEDADQDGFGADVAASPCPDPAWTNWTQLPGDCADDDPARNPSQVEVCGDPGVDEDCNGVADEDDPGALLDRFYQDGDGDGFGDSTFSQTACTVPSGFVADSTDCDDSNATEWAESVVLEGLPGEPSLQEAVDSLCESGTLLLDPDLTWPAALVIDKSIGIAPSDFQGPVTVTAAAIDEPLFSVAPFADLTIQGLVLQGGAFDRSVAAIQLGSLAGITANTVGIGGFRQVDSAFIEGELGFVDIANSAVENTRADRGLIGVEVVTASISGSVFTDLLAQPLPDGSEAALLRTSALSTFSIDGILCTRCGAGSTAIRTREVFLGTSGDQQIGSSAFLDSGGIRLGGGIAMDDARFVRTTAVPAGAPPFLTTTFGSDLALSNVGFQGTSGLVFAGSVTGSVVTLREVGAPDQPSVTVGLFTTMDLSDSLLVDLASEIQVDGTLSLTGSRIVRPGGVGGSWATGSNVVLTNSVVSAAPTDLVAVGSARADNSAWLTSVESGVTTGELNVFVDTPEMQPLWNSMFTEGVPAGCLFLGCQDFVFGEQVLLTYSDDVDPELWLPFFTLDSNADHIDVSLVSDDADGTDGDVGLNGGELGLQDAFFADADNDGLQDGWDMLHRRMSLTHRVDEVTPSSPADGLFFCTDLAAGQDCDQDGLDDLTEQEAGTWPSVADTDGDGILDGDEQPGRELLDD